MAIQTQTQAYYVNTVNQNPPRRFKGGPEQPLFVEGTTQSWGIGDLIYNNGTSNLQICTVNGSSQMTSQIAGQAKTRRPARPAPTDPLLHRIRPDEEFFMNVYHGTIGSAITAKTQIGTPRALVRINGIWMVDIENAVEGSANALARVLHHRYPAPGAAGNVNTIGDTYGFVVAVFLPVSISLTGTLAAQRLLQCAT
jgi:hypothetical protein